MRAARLTALAALMLGLTACAGGGERDEARPRDAGTTASTPTATMIEDETAAAPQQRQAAARPPVLGAVRAVSKRPTRPELRWFGTFNRWWYDFSADLERVAGATDAITAGRVEGGANEDELLEALDRLRHCETEFSRRVPFVPSKRLRVLHALLTDTCFAIEDGAARGMQILVHGTEPDLIREWREEWDEAAGMMHQAFRRISAYDPSHARKLRVRGGLVSESRIEPKLSRAASAVTAKKVRVRCWSRGDWSTLLGEMRLYTGGRITKNTIGFATLGGEDVDLAPDVCAWLADAVYAGARPSSGREQMAMALSVGVLAHETRHCSGVVNEAAAECYGMQTLAAVATRLGLGRAYARELAATYWREAYKIAPAVYRSKECRDGGALDRNPNRKTWP